MTNNIYINKQARSNNTIPDAEWLLGCAAADGVIAEEPGATNVFPYMSNYAAIGLTRAYEVTGNPNYIAPVWAWLGWYRDHMDPTTGYVNDYVGPSGARVDQNNKDSTDAYAGTYLVALYLAYSVDPAGDTKLIPFYDSIPLAMTAIESTQQSDGLTYALPTYDVKYLEDNIETLVGARAAALLAAVAAVSTAMPDLLARCNTTANAMAKGIGYMWNNDASSWDYAIHSSHAFANNNWSDDNAQRQQIWATAWNAIASKVQGQAIMAAYAVASPDWATRTYEVMPVWAYRNVQNVNTANAGWLNFVRNAEANNRGYPWTCAIAGQSIIGMLGFPSAMPNPKIVFPDGTNLMPDPKFLTDTNSDGRPDVIVGTYGDPQFSLHSLVTGGNYLTVNSPDGNNYAFNWDLIPVEENTYVTFSFFERITRLGSGNVTIKYELYDASNNLVTYGYNTKSAVSGPEFSRWYINAWIPPGVTHMKPVFEDNSCTIDIAYPQVEVSGSPTAPPYGVPVP